MEVTDELITQWVGQILWPLFRVAGFLAIMPVLGAQSVSVRVRVALAISIAVLIAPMLDVPAVNVLSPEVLVITLWQLLLGLIIGFFFLMLLQIFVVAGQMISMQMGLGFASMMDPANGVSVSILSQWYQLLITLLFIAADGHLVALQILVYSFETFPVSSYGISQLDWGALIHLGSWMFVSALQLAMPAVTALLFVNLIFGVMTRSAPQLNVFALGFPITMLLGLFVSWMTIGTMMPRFNEFMWQAFWIAEDWVSGGR